MTLNMAAVPKTAPPIDINNGSSSGGGTGGGGVVASWVSGQAKISTSGTAVQLASNVLTNGVVVTAAVTNTADILIGTSNGVTRTEDGTGNGYVLTPGQSIAIAISNTNLAFINGAANDYVSFAGN